MNVLFQKRLFDTLKHHFILKVLALNARQQWGRGLFVPGCYLDIPCIYIYTWNITFSLSLFLIHR